MLSEAMFGLLGLVSGAMIGFFGDIYINNRRMKFEAYKDIKRILNRIHNKLVDDHSKIQKYYVDHRGKDPKENILALKDFHWQVMEIYKEFRIYFGDLKAYELQSAVYNYYYELAKEKSDETFSENQFFMAYQALKDAYGLMISEVKLGLISVNFIKKADNKLEKNKKEEYKKYTSRLEQTLSRDLKDKVTTTDDDSPVGKAASVVKERMGSFEDELKNRL